MTLWTTSILVPFFLWYLTQSIGTLDLLKLGQAWIVWALAENLSNRKYQTPKICKFKLSPQATVLRMLCYVPFPLWNLSLNMATLHVLNPWRAWGIVKLSLLGAWDGSCKYQTLTRNVQDLNSSSSVKGGLRKLTNPKFYSKPRCTMHSLLGVP
jgi:hypothetical protein